MKRLLPVLLVLALVPVFALSLIRAPGAGTVYAVGDVRYGLAHNARSWVGRALLVRGTLLRVREVPCTARGGCGGIRRMLRIHDKTQDIAHFVSCQRTVMCGTFTEAADSTLPDAVATVACPRCGASPPLYVFQQPGTSIIVPITAVAPARTNPVLAALQRVPLFGTLLPHPSSSWPEGPGVYRITIVRQGRTYSIVLTISSAASR